MDPTYFHMEESPLVMFSADVRLFTAHRSHYLIDHACAQKTNSLAHVLYEMQSYKWHCKQ